jgi:hypothetical protein
MKKTLMCVGVMLTMPWQSIAVYKKLTEKEISEAVSFGKNWKNSSKFLQEGLKSYKFQIDSAMSWDGTSKHVKFFTDWVNIASTAVVANRQLRELSAAEIEKIPRTGLLIAIVELHARGAIPVLKLEKRFTEGNTHLVLKIGEKIIQPQERFTLSDDLKKTWSELGWRTGNYIENEERKLTLQFAFDLDEQQLNSKATAILLDADGKQRKVDVELSKLK